MGWGLVAAAVAPTLVSAILPKPKIPGYQGPGVPTDRSKYINSLLETGFSDQSKEWGLAADIAQDRVNRILGRSGMAGSSVGAQLHSMTQGDLAAKFLEGALDRKARALAPVLTYDNNLYSARAGNANAAYNSAMDSYNAMNQRNAGTVQGISGLINAGMGAYQMNQAQGYREQQLAQNQQVIDMMRTNYGAPTYGVPSYQIQPAGPPSGYGLGGDYTFRPGI